MKEEEFTQRFAAVLKELALSDGARARIESALMSKADNQRARRESEITQLREQYVKLDSRLSTMYDDKLDCNISAELFASKTVQFKAEQARLLAAIQTHQLAAPADYNDGVRLLELANKAHDLFFRQTAVGRRNLLKLICSNCTWRNDALQVVLLEPFETSRVTKRSVEAKGVAKHVSGDPVKFGSAGWTRTSNLSINSRMLYH